MDTDTLVIVGATLGAALLGGLASTWGGYLAQRALHRRGIRTELFRDLVPKARSELALKRWGHSAGTVGIPRIQLYARHVADIVTAASTAGRRDAKRGAMLMSLVDDLLQQDERLEAAQRAAGDPVEQVYTEAIKAETDAVLTDAIEGLDAYWKWLGKKLGSPVPPFDPHR